MGNFFNTMAGRLLSDISQTELSAIPGPLAELVVLYIEKEWLIKYKTHLRALNRPISIFFNILLPNEGVGRIMTQLNSDFWISFKDECEKKMKRKNPQTRKFQGEKAKELVEILKEKGGRLGQRIARWYEDGEFEAKVNNLKDKISNLNLSAKLDQIREEADKEIDEKDLLAKALAKAEKRKASYRAYIESRKI